ncbi:3-oxoacyl-ACP synthase III family protein [Fulvivirga ligni]|uniref:3-oxoacyl-ACP synthase III family protein n=1 Tax=Fulvivirga ligni TaxID=2904246 RepID=UPI001F24E006|nr:ketoacyl-ACP synthase III [Fulvivirga ligni]UII20887.1 ketoacyl-ACP synthase III [Fulvivirga ligni]
MRKAVITGTGSYAPEQVLKNEYFNELLGEDVDTWLRENLTIEQRHWCADDESTVDLCEKAALKALESAGIAAKELDQIIISTDTPEYISPATASVLQHRLGAEGAGTFDLNTACAGFVSAIDTASKYILADEQYKHILVIGVYAMSKYLNKSDKKTVTLFADGAGAVVLSAKDNTDSGFLNAHQFTQGQYHDWMGIYAGGTHCPITETAVQNGKHQLQFVKKFPKELNPEMWTKMSLRMAREAGIEVCQVSKFFLTQININSIYEMLENLNLAKDKAKYIMHKYGYTGSAAIPMALDEAVRKGEIQKGDYIFLIGSGGGLSFAGAAFKF